MDHDEGIFFSLEELLDQVVDTKHVSSQEVIKISEKCFSAKLKWQGGHKLGWRTILRGAVVAIS